MESDDNPQKKEYILMKMRQLLSPYILATSFKDEGQSLIVRLNLLMPLT
ncbi:hypothetical protein CLV73_0458 [Chryseobacterium geocarposphaerae]|uniref:Uncharacterized protein n=1 Tax=Chryseobacterium geocarposphaerae TaxID=1416776 RepID=A0A2M9C6P3_9FLAO|nr:hypothetical protein CLV73_0458 [Chryseobacterium geocarposphaerae]